MTLRRTAYSTQLSFSIPQVDKDIAEKADKYFDHLRGIIDKATKHLDIIADSFQGQDQIEVDETVKNRAALREYRDQIISNFNDVKKIALECFKLMNHFSSDTEISELMTSFTNELDEVETYVNTLTKSFDDLSNEDFKNIIIKAIEDVKKQTSQLIQLIDDRILSHIDNNILGKDWVSNVSNELQTTVDENIPALIQLRNERENVVNNVTGVK